MFEPLEKSEQARERSLLTLARALQDERTRRENPPAQPTLDAAARHRAARMQREAGLAAQSQPVSPVEPAAAMYRAELPATRYPTANQRETLPETRQRSATRRADDDGWQPLINPHLVLSRIARSKALIASTTVLGALLGVAIAISTPKQYEALTEVMIYPRDLKIVDREITAADLPSDAMLGIIENNARILTSGPVLTNVVSKLNLVSDPEFNGKGDAGLSDLMNPIALVRSLLSRSDGPDDARLESKAATALYQKISVDRTGKTFILNVNVATEDGEKSALIANTLVEAFIAYTGQIQSDTAGRATSELTSRLEEMRKSVEAAEDKVDAYKAENDIIDPQGRSIADEDLIKLNEQLSIARARTLELDSKAASARQLDVNSVVSGSLPEGTSSGVLTELRSQYASIKQSVDNAAVTLGPRHPQRQALEAQLAGARDQISGELRRIVSSMQVELKRAVELEQDLAARLAQLKVQRGSTNQDMVKLRELERDLNSKRSVYESFLLRARETGEQKDLNTANISIISPATAPLEPSGPSRAVTAGTGTVLGFLAGLGLAGFAGAIDSVRGASEARRRRRRLDDEQDEPTRGVTDPYASPSVSEVPAYSGGEAVNDTPPAAFGARESIPVGPAQTQDVLATQSAPTADADLYQSMDEIRATVNECRDLIRQLADRQDRRYF